ncbi:MAG TPA: cytochrome-c oxidase, cbb3-type subunit III [Burkholderiaceae bacterium]|nr:cytochrome-c oxidase, cbb3-type subunit III [Burkholderiaceae bacterium]
MSDFLHSGWSIFVAASTVIGLLACLWLLWVASKRQPMAADNSTGHVFDGDLVEMNNPLPRWWMILFILTVVFAFGYVGLFGGLGSSKGSLDWSSQAELEADQKANAASVAVVYQAFKGMPVQALATQPKAMAIGERLFANNCATCHGSDARGSKGFPNLTDNDWLHGGTPEKIEETITHGRHGMMPPMAEAVGTPQDVRNVANYVLSLSGSAHNPIQAAAGRAKFAVCAACHGADGKGNAALGSANLTDKIWLHGWGEAAIVDIVTHGKTNVMPAQKDRLTPDQIHVLAAYVWAFSNHTAAAAP